MEVWDSHKMPGDLSRFLLGKGESKGIGENRDIFGAQFVRDNLERWRPVFDRSSDRIGQDEAKRSSDRPCRAETVRQRAGADREGTGPWTD